MFSQIFFPLGNALASSSMLPPSNLAAQLLTPDDAKLTWSGVYGASGYNVYEITEGQLILLNKVTTTSYTLNNIAEGSHRYVVSTLSSDGETGPSAPVTVDIVYPKMKSPTNLSNTIANGNDITLNWNAADNVEKYNVYQISNDGEKTLLTSQTTRSYKILDAPEGTFTYAVTAWHSLYGESSLSNPTEVKIVYPTMIVPNTFTYSIANGNDVTLKWDAVSYTETYNLYEITNGEKVLKAAVTGTTFKLTNAPAGNYKYEIRSNHSQFGESAEGKILEVIVDEITMAAPNNFTYELQNVNDIYLKWDQVPYADNYSIYEVIDGEKVLKTNNHTGTNIKYLKAEAGNHTYVIHSFSSKFGESAEGSQVSLSIDQVVMEAPGNVKYNIQNGNDIELSWESTSNTTNYKIYQIIDGQKVLKATLASTGTAYTFAKMPAGEYKYEIYSYSTRFGESEQGSQLAISLVHPVLKPPVNLKETILNETDFSLAWDEVDFAESYRIYQIVDGVKTFKGSVSTTNKTYSSMPSGDYSYIIYSYSSRFGESKDGTQLNFYLKGKAMLPPANPQYSIANGNDIKLNWAAAADATGYKVYQFIGEEKVLKRTLPGTTVSFTNTPTGDYHYVIHSYSDLFGESEEGATVKFELVHPVMAAPEELSHTVKNGNDLLLTWKAVDYANSYKLYEIVESEKILVYEGSSLTRTLSKVPAGKHSYVVHSVSSRFGESPLGKELTVTMQEYTMEAPEVTNQSVTNINTLKIDWTAVEYANRYKVYEVVDGEKKLKTTVTAPTASFSNLTEGKHLFVIHSDSDRFGESPEGSQVSVDIVFPEIKAPENLTHEIKNGNDVNFTWSKADYATTYKVYEIVENQKKLLTTVSTVTALLVNVSEGKHSYVVHTFSSRFGESEEGTKLGISVEFPIMQAPAKPVYSFENGNDLKLEWNQVDYAKNYKVYEIIDGEKVFQRTVTGLKTTFINIADGKHDYEVYSNSDRFGESPVGSSLSLDLIYPTMQAPENLTKSIVNGNDVTLKWDAATYATSYKVYQLIEGEKVFKKTVSGTSVSFPNLPEGDYAFEIHSVSDRFGESPVAAKHSFEMIFPVMQKPENFYETIVRGNDIQLRWNAAEYATAYRVYQVIDGKKELIRSLPSLLTTFTNMPEGDYEYVIHSYSDRFGESPEGSSLTFNLTWPVVETPILTGSVFNVNNITLTWPAADWANEYRVYQITDGNRELIYKGTLRSYKVYNLTEDTHSFEVTAYNTRFGESTSSNLVTETVVYPDMETPKATLKLLSDTSAFIYWDFVTYANGYNIYEMIDGKPVLVAEKVNNLSYTLTNLSYANHLYYVTSYSNSFGESEPSETVLAKLIIDEEAPVTSSDVKVDWTNHSTTVSLSATDNETGVKATYYSLDGINFEEGTSFKVEKEGVNTVSFYSVDNVGNKEKVKTAEVKIDKTAPQTSSDLIDQWNTTDVKVQLSSTDNLSGTARTFYSVDGSEYVEGTSFTVSGDKIHDVSYYSVDTAGNEEEVKSQLIKIDVKAPATTSDIADQWNQTEVIVKLTATDNLSGAAKTYYSVDGSEYVEGTSFTVSGDKIHEVSYYSVDNAGNIEKVTTQQVKIDGEAPKTSDNHSDLWSKTDVEVVLKAEDNLSSVAKTYYSINGSEYNEGISFTVSKEGINEVKYYSVDVAGNKENVKTIQVKVDKTAPVINADINEEYRLGSEFGITYSTVEKHSGVAVEEVTLNGVPYQNGDIVTLDQPGVYALTITVTDQASWATTFEKTFVVYIPVSLEVLPKVIKGNKGIFTVKANLPKEFSSSTFEVSTATLNGVAPKLDNNGLTKQAEKGHFKFEREDFDWKQGKVELEFRAYLANGYLVVGKTIVDVK
jgi:large repetitive protein